MGLELKRAVRDINLRVKPIERLSGNPALGSLGSMVGLMVTSKRVSAKADLPVSPSLWGAY